METPIKKPILEVKNYCSEVRNELRKKHQKALISYEKPITRCPDDPKLKQFKRPVTIDVLPDFFNVEKIINQSSVVGVGTEGKYTVVVLTSPGYGFGLRTTAGVGKELLEHLQRLAPLLKPMTLEAKVDVFIQSELPIEGTSASLPLLMAIIATCRGDKLDPKIIFSGIVNSDGTLDVASGIKRKMKFLEEHEELVVGQGTNWNLKEVYEWCKLKEETEDDDQL